MKIESFGSRRSIFWSGIALITIVGLFLSSRAFDPRLISNDTSQQILGEQNLLAGNGFATSAPYYPEHYRQEQFPPKLTNWPPGQAFLIAFLGIFGLKAMPAAVAIAVTGFAISVGAVIAVTNRLVAPPLLALAAGGLWVCSPLAWTEIATGGTDLPLTGASLLACLLWMRAHDDNGHRLIARFVAAGIACACAVAFRYSAIFFIVGFALVAAIRAWQQYRDRFLTTMTVLLLPAAALFTVMAIRNKMLTGLWGGRTTVPHPGTLWDIGEQSLKVLRNFLMGSGSGEFSLAAIWMVGLAAGLFLAALIVVVLLESRPPGRRPAGIFSDQLYDIMILTLPAVTTIGTLLAMALTEDPEYFYPRYLIVTIPLLLPVAAAAIGARIAGRTSRKSRVGLTVLAAAVLAFIGTETWVSAHRLQQGRLASNWPLLLQAADALRALARTEATSAGEMRNLSNENQRFALASATQSFGLPGSLYTRDVWSESRVRNLMERMQIKYIVLFPDSFDPSDRNDANRRFLQHLIKGRYPAWLQLSYNSAGIRIYSVKAQ